MELMTEEKKGYKRTKIGFIPKDWEVKVIDQLTSRVGDGIHATPNYDESGSYYFINGNNLSNGKIFVNESTKKVSEEEFKIHKRDLSDTTILLSINGTIGNVAFYRNEPVLLGKSAAYLNVSPNARKEYLFYQLQTEYVQEYFYNNLTGTTIKNLGLGTIRSTPIPLPPTLSEQQAIASALSDVDELIRSLDGLIQKKQAIKKGTMQQLLTGKKRLPGFDGEWEVKKLGEVLDIDPENLSSSTNPDYEFEYLSLEDVNRGVIKSKTKHRYADSPSRARRVLREGDVGFGTVRPTNQSHFLIENEVDDLICSTGFAVMRPQGNVMKSEYLFYSLFTYQINEQVNQIIAGSNYPAVNSRDVKHLKLNFPTDIEEQKAIAHILSDMDRELQTLRQKREKYVQIKQGMMQQLLTGRIRIHGMEG